MYQKGLFHGINKNIDTNACLTLTGHKSSYYLLSPDEVPGVIGRILWLSWPDDTPRWVLIAPFGDKARTQVELASPSPESQSNVKWICFSFWRKGKNLTEDTPPSLSGNPQSEPCSICPHVTGGRNVRQISNAAVLPCWDESGRWQMLLMKRNSRAS